MSQKLISKMLSGKVVYSDKALVCSSLILSSRLRKDIQHLLLEGFSHFLPIAIQDVHLDRRIKFPKLQKSQDDANPALLGGHY